MNCLKSQRTGYERLGWQKKFDLMMIEFFDSDFFLNWETRLRSAKCEVHASVFPPLHSLTYSLLSFQSLPPFDDIVLVRPFIVIVQLPDFHSRERPYGIKIYVHNQNGKAKKGQENRNWFGWHEHRRTALHSDGRSRSIRPSTHFRHLTRSVSDCTRHCAIRVCVLYALYNLVCAHMGRG